MCLRFMEKNEFIIMYYLINGRYGVDLLPYYLMIIFGVILLAGVIVYILYYVIRFFRHRKKKIKEKN